MKKSIFKRFICYFSIMVMVMGMTGCGNSNSASSDASSEASETGEVIQETEGVIDVSGDSAEVVVTSSDASSDSSDTINLTEYLKTLPDRNGYNDETNDEYGVYGIAFYVPDYMTRVVDADTDEEDTVKFQFDINEDAGTAASFEVNYPSADYVKEDFIEDEDAIVEQYTDADGILDSELISQESTKILGNEALKFKVNAILSDNIPVEMEFVYIFVEDQNKVVSFSMVQSAYAAYDYCTDFERIIDNLHDES